MTGFDTGFFVKLLQNVHEAVTIWKNVFEKERAVISCLSLYELKKLALKGAIDSNSMNRLLTNLPYVCEIIWLDNNNIVQIGSKISHSFGLPSIDSLILAGFVKQRVNKIYTTDKHFKRYKKAGIKIILL